MSVPGGVRCEVFTACYQPSVLHEEALCGITVGHEGAFVGDHCPPRRGLCGGSPSPTKGPQVGDQWGVLHVLGWMVLGSRDLDLCQSTRESKANQANRIILFLDW